MKKEESTTKCPICGKPTHKESKYCIFHASAEEKTEEDFKQALKKYILEIELSGEDYNFNKFIFIGDIDFKNDLNIIIFKNTYFGEASFGGNAVFRKTVFEGATGFQKATFGGSANFDGATFERGVSFQEATFKGAASFQKATFGGGDFSGLAPYTKINEFSVILFKGAASFQKATFEGDVGFRINTFIGEIIFKNIMVFPGKKLSIEAKNCKGTISFECAYLENVYLDIELDEGVLTNSTDTILIDQGVFINLTDAFLRNTKIKKDQIKNHILQEEKKKFSKAQEIFLLLKNNFHSIGRYNDESWAFLKEKEMERLSYYFNAFTKNTESKEDKNEEKDQKVKELKAILCSNWIKIKEFGKWLWSGFCNAIYGYGEKPQNVVLSAVFIILLFAISFSIIGIANPKIIELKGITVDQNTGNIVDSASKGLLINNVIRNIPDSLYFSLITFTTLGYGDFRPLEGIGRILAGSEAFIGAFMIALFVYTFARRTGGR